MDGVRTSVTFKSSAFNVAEPRDHYYHPNNFGDDLATWIMQALEPRGYRGGEEWLGWVERKAGLLASLFGGRKRGIQPEATLADEAVLSSAPEIRAVRWHFEEDFVAGRE